MTDVEGAGGLSHVGADGKARMVDVAAKSSSTRVAEAEGYIRMLPGTLIHVRDNSAAKGDVLGVARIAGILAAKRTSDLIPLCHGLALDHVAVEFELRDAESRVRVQARASTRGPTGVEMEALTAVSVAALTVYDMLKAVDRGMTIEGIRLTLKSGGRSGTYRAGEAATPDRTP